MKLHRLLVVMGVAALSACGQKPEAPKSVVPPILPAPVIAPAPPPAPVEKPPVFTPAIATLEGSSEATVIAPVDGFLIQQNYQDDTIVKKGSVLFVINPLRAAGMPSADATKTKYQAIVSPAAGVASRSPFGSGDSVTAGMTLTNISTIEPIAAEFAVTADYYAKCTNRFTNDLNLPPDQRPREIELILADGTPYPHKGWIDKIEKSSSTAAHPVTVRALFDNPDHILKPDLYVRIQAVFP